MCYVFTPNPLQRPFTSTCLQQQTGFPLLLPPAAVPLSPGEEDCRRCSQELGEAETTKPDLWRNTKHQQDCQPRQPIAREGRKTDVCRHTGNQRQQKKCGGCFCRCHVGRQGGGCASAVTSQLTPVPASTTELYSTGRAHYWVSGPAEAGKQNTMKGFIV